MTHKPRFKKLVKPPIQAAVLSKKLIEHMNEGVWMGDKEERTVYANPKFCEMTGYALKEMLGRESYDFWDEESVKKVRSVNISHRGKGISSSYEGVLVAKNEKRVPVLISGTPLPDGGTIGIITDLSNLKQKEETAKVLSSAIEYATDAIIIFNNGKVYTWNKGAKIIFGYKKSEIVGCGLDKIFSKKDLEKILRYSTVVYNLELKGKHKNRKTVLISATLNPILSDNNKNSGFCLLIGRDITNQSKFEEELMLKYRKIKEAYNRFGILRRQMDYLFEILELFGGTYDKKSIADYIVSSIIMLTRVNACVMRIYNHKKETLDLVSSFGVGNNWSGIVRIPYKKSLTEKAFNAGAPLKIIDVAKEPRYYTATLAKKNNLCSLLLIPLQFKSKLVGSLSLYTDAKKKLEIFENEFIEKYAKLIEIVVGTLLMPP